MRRNETRSPAPACSGFIHHHSLSHAHRVSALPLFPSDRLRGVACCPVRPSLASASLLRPRSSSPHARRTSLFEGREGERERHWTERGRDCQSQCHFGNIFLSHYGAFQTPIILPPQRTHPLGHSCLLSSPLCDVQAQQATFHALFVSIEIDDRVCQPDGLELQRSEVRVSFCSTRHSEQR